MFFPIGTDRAQRVFPLINVLLIALNVYIYFQSHFGPGYVAAQHSFMDAGLLRAWEPYMLYPKAPQWTQFITYQFLHANPGHIFFNMLFLYVFGNNLNEKLGHVGYLAFYLAGGVFAGMGQVLTSSDPTLGASGSISAVAGLFLVLLPRTHIRLFVWLFIYADVWEIPSLYFVLFKIVQDVLEQFMSRSQGVAQGVAYMAHISGSLMGIAMGLVLLLTHLVQRDHYDLLAMVNRYRRRRDYESLVARGYEPFRAGRGGTVAVETTSVASGKAAAVKTVDPRIESLRAEISRLIRLHELPDASVRYLELRGIDEKQVLSEAEQLDVGNQLMADGKYAEAAGAYEDYLRVFTGGGQKDQVTLMLGLIYSRYVPRRERAKELFKAVLPRLHLERERQMAEGELQWLESEAPSGGPAAG